MSQKSVHRFKFVHLFLSPSQQQNVIRGECLLGMCKLGDEKKCNVSDFVILLKIVGLCIIFGLKWKKENIFEFRWLEIHVIFMMTRIVLIIGIQMTHY